MSNNQLAGFPAFRPRVDSTITYYPRTQTLSPEYQIPEGASIGTDPHISWTLASSDLPSGHPVSTYKYEIYSQLKCVTAGNVFSRTRLNGGAWSSWSGAKAMTTGQYYMNFKGGSYDAGDVHDIQFCTSTGSGSVIKLIWGGLICKIDTIYLPSSINQQFKVSYTDLFGLTNGRLVYSPFRSYMYDEPTQTYRSINANNTVYYHNHRLITESTVLQQEYVGTSATTINSGSYFTRIAYTPIL